MNKSFPEHKNRDIVATNVNGEKVRSRMKTSSAGKCEYGGKEDESSTGCVWAAGFHHVTTIFAIDVRFETYETSIF
jgi:hypothetical protein